MTERHYQELSGAVWIPSRQTEHETRILALLSDCECLHAEFVDSDARVHAAVDAFLEYLFANPQVGGYVSWNCEIGYVGLEFGEDGAVVVLWADGPITEAAAVRHVEMIFHQTSAAAGYVALGGWMPGTSAEFIRAFEGTTLNRFGAI